MTGYQVLSSESFSEAPLNSRDQKPKFRDGRATLSGSPKVEETQGFLPFLLRIVVPGFGVYYAPKLALSIGLLCYFRQGLAVFPRLTPQSPASTS